MTSDPDACAVGRNPADVFPALRMVLRFVPFFSARAKEIIRAQAAAFPKARQSKLSRCTSAFSILTTWALENGIDTADSVAGGADTVQRGAQTAVQNVFPEKTLCSLLSACYLRPPRLPRFFRKAVGLVLSGLLCDAGR